MLRAEGETTPVLLLLLLMHLPLLTRLPLPTKNKRITRNIGTI
jgi:hypothetical protein